MEIPIYNTIGSNIHYYSQIKVLMKCTAKDFLVPPILLNERLNPVLEGEKIAGTAPGTLLCI